MHVTTAPQSSPAGLAYLRHIGELSAEVQVAMDAIGCNALSILEQSVSRQEALCAELITLARALPGGTGKRSSQESLPWEDSLSLRIEAAGASLIALNLRYAALLEHSSHSVRMFAGLCRGYAAQGKRGARAWGTRPELSCRM